MRRRPAWFRRLILSDDDIFKPLSRHAEPDARQSVDWVVAPGSASLRMCGAASPRRDGEAIASYEILMPETIIRYGIFAAFGANNALWTRLHPGGRRV